MLSPIAITTSNLFDAFTGAQLLNLRLFCFGYGYVAEHLAQGLRGLGAAVTGTTRDADKAARIGGYVLNGNTPLNPQGLQALHDATHVLVSIPPEEDGVDAAFRHYADALKRKQWIGYLSTTGVYGDWNGEWVDETSAMLASEPRSVRRIEAERHWHAHHAHIFRLAGIYGRGRNALAQVRKGEARRIHKEGQYFSRIHVEDIVQAVTASMNAPAAGSIYNLCDDAPSPSHEVIAYACELLGQELPPLVPVEQAALSPMARSFYAANRRVRNDKMKEKLGVELRYPSYREGLASLLHEEEGV